MKQITWVLFPIFLLLCSCATNPAEHVSSETNTKDFALRKGRIHPSFSSDSALAFIKKQCDFGFRLPNTAEHDACGNFLVHKLNSFGCTTTVQSFTSEAYDGTKLKGMNIIGQFCPEIEKRIVLFSHWDTRPVCDNDVESNWKKPVMGANDGASGVGVLLEVVRQLQMEGDSIGVDIVFLDLEDYGQPSFEKQEKKDTWCLGSQYLASHPYYKCRPRMGILLDMVGAKNPFFGFDQVSLYFAENYLQKIWSIAKSLGYASAFIPKESGTIMDDHYYINTVAQIPTVDIIDFNHDRGFPETWHTVNDTPENIHKETLQMVGEVVLSFVRGE